MIARLDYLFVKGRLSTKIMYSHLRQPYLSVLEPDNKPRADRVISSTSLPTPMPRIHNHKYYVLPVNHKELPDRLPLLFLLTYHAQPKRCPNPFPSLSLRSSSCFLRPPVAFPSHPRLSNSPSFPILTPTIPSF